MSYQLTASEMLDALIHAKHPSADAFKSIMEGLGSSMAIALAEIAQCNVGDATFDCGDICAPFYPKYQGQALPDVIAGYDQADEWEPL